MPGALHSRITLWLDLIRWDRQYPVFADIPEVLSTSSGKPGRKLNYSAVVEVIHLSAPSSLPCQSIKRFDTATGRIDKDLAVVSREVAAGGTVTIPGLGKVACKARPERMVRNPATGETIKIKVSAGEKVPPITRNWD